MMKRTLMAAAAALALAVPAGMASAQDAAAQATTTVAAPVLTAEQQTMFDAWPDDRKASYETWPDTYKTYFWTLTPEQQAGWWVLTAEQRARVYAMTPDGRAQAWAAIVAQINGAPAPAPAGTAAPAPAPADTATPMPAPEASTMPAPAGNMQFVRKEMAQPVAASADAAALQSGDLPVCKAGQQDGCINGWEKNRRGNKPLDHWPGKPASEMKEPG